MKRITLITLLATTTLFSFCSEEEIEPRPDVKLTQAEIDDLKFLREEEKLARDVYLFSYEKYEEEIFNKISQSEQRHMNKVLQLLNTYNIEDPALTERGVFTNQTLQTLYDDLIALSSVSLIDALKVGATIEDLDIRDIALNEGRTTASDITNVYSKLKCGSTNHIRSFNARLIENGETYVPQYITTDYFNEIIDSPKQQCGKH